MGMGVYFLWTFLSKLSQLRFFDRYIMLYGALLVLEAVSPFHGDVNQEELAGCFQDTSAQLQ
jgi:hypothetical protein